MMGSSAVVPLRELLVVLLISAVVTFLATGGVRVLAIGFGAVAVPRDRDVHVKPIPRMGGVGMYIGVVAAVLFAHQLPALRSGFDYKPNIPIAVLVASTVIVLVGIVDDRWGLDALTKFAGQVTAAGVMAVMGLGWYVVYNPFSNTTVVLDGLQGGLVTVAVTVTLVNAMNFVDGLDGLAAGLGLIAALAVFVFCLGLMNEQGGSVDTYPPALLAAALAGGCLGFLPHNFQPARIFMGDSGSMLIGLMLAAVSTGASGRIPLQGYGPRDIVGLLSPLLLVGAVMFIPVLDLLLAIVRRVRAGVSFSTPDKMHLHHRLLQIGHSHRRVVLLIYLWVGVLAFGAVGTSLMDRTLVVLLMAGGLVFALVITAIPGLRRGDPAGDGSASG
ncbi:MULTISPECIES: glycosyltransferase family 4 protein [Nocardia]|jgi:UDP-GlcNAc:undecaprenyl-phosphate/decaprenyl-phosphate GlcNAc-1-phosphate transferase|uniref:glycosyltransferase family 4 protein n=1 Tax=Nocardia TaxID=1817 RepID=UPI0002F58C15|nr:MULTISPECIES: MraY family glycosyltransferase [Nocardia]MBF6168130.1 undecaprenyl/decaprenyl-phosphate alpha-N-acetylglucosaminyl 1-phosphate transferase [Streptomyces gardneri]UAK32917.1 undecaprenyl/decaprenyl-phosphate alpha-N-acetylglucosaminyl 1-phosphate transferase [Nocardia asteroides]MBF6204789.1 undecaprenyl/decaprenyl-phosphate alpha-N-acetylglucosaminyl 1-phosphate transferase [Streptomyces gardneri]MBF6219617.1 undecaprenyl/decaprenyl-phosphate alpha-N-acetylglucosaminyl 1-phosp